MHVSISIWNDPFTVYLQPRVDSHLWLAYMNLRPHLAFGSWQCLLKLMSEWEKSLVRRWHVWLIMVVTFYFDGPCFLYILHPCFASAFKDNFLERRTVNAFSNFLLLLAKIFGLVVDHFCLWYVAGKLKPQIKYYLPHRLVKDRMKNPREKGRNGQRRRHLLLLMVLLLAILLTRLRELNTQLMSEFF